MIPTISQHLLELGPVGSPRTFAGINENLEYLDTACLAVLPDFSLLSRKTVVL
jgi:hypothetical protein